MRNYSLYYIKEFTKKILMVSAGVTAAACGIALFYTMNIGSDPISVFVDGQHRILGLSYGAINLLNSIVYFIFVLIFSRKLINYATLIVGFAMGPMINFFFSIFSRYISSDGSLTLQFLAGKGFVFNSVEGDYFIRLLMQIPAVILLGCGLGLYLSANLGAAPLDALVLFIKEKTQKPLRKVKIIFDLAAAAIGFLLGGVAGIGTIIAILATGPIVSLTIKTIANLENGMEYKK